MSLKHVNTTIRSWNCMSNEVFAIRYGIILWLTHYELYLRCQLQHIIDILFFVILNKMVHQGLAYLLQFNSVRNQE